jgi:hypothetical protein
MNTAGSFTARAITREDLGRHEPPDELDESWQESWALTWHDPKTRTGGWHHIGLQRPRGFADVWSWVTVDGVIVGRYDNLRHPLPDDDFPDFVLGGMSVEIKDLRSLSIEAVFDNAFAALDYAAFTDPLMWSIKPDAIAMGTSHYESFGRVEGTITTRNGEIAVIGAAWQDHSWGPRDWSQSLAHRWIMANFGPDLCISAWQVMTEGGRVLAGFVCDEGTFHGVDRVTFGASVDDDGYTPARCDAHIWTELGQGYHLVGTVDGAGSVAHDAGYWMTDGLAVFRMGGRLGAGVFEVRERAKLPAPELIAGAH